MGDVRVVNFAFQCVVLLLYWAGEWYFVLVFGSERFPVRFSCLVSVVLRYFLLRVLVVRCLPLVRLCIGVVFAGSFVSVLGRFLVNSVFVVGVGGGRCYGGARGQACWGGVLLLGAKL